MFVRRQPCAQVKMEENKMNRRQKGTNTKIKRNTIKKEGQQT
jgi:hypothetical protein